MKTICRYAVKALAVAFCLLPFVCVEHTDAAPHRLYADPTAEHYKGEPYRLWRLAHHDTVLLGEQIEKTIGQPQGIYQGHAVKVRVIDVIKGKELPQEYLIYGIVYEVSPAKQQKPGTYPMSGRVVLGFNRGNLKTDSATGLPHAGDLTFDRMGESALQYLPMLKKDYPLLFEESGE